MEQQKSVTWEKEDTYLRVYHHDEYYKSGGVHLVHIRNRGNMLQMHDESLDGATPDRSRTSGDGPPRRVTMRSGLTEFIISEERFESWWNWFERKHLRDESFVLRSSVGEHNLPEWLVDKAITVELE